MRWHVVLRSLTLVTHTNLFGVSFINSAKSEGSQSSWLSGQKPVPPVVGKEESGVEKSDPGWFQASGKLDDLLSWQHFFDAAINMVNEVLSCPKIEA